MLWLYLVQADPGKLAALAPVLPARLAAVEQLQRVHPAPGADVHLPNRMLIHQ